MIKDKLTTIVGGVVGLVILLTIFCCEGKREAVEEVVVPVEEAVEELKVEVKEVIEEVTPKVEEVTPEVEEVIPTETVAPAETAE